MGRYCQILRFIKYNRTENDKTGVPRRNNFRAEIIYMAMELKRGRHRPTFPLELFCDTAFIIQTTSKYAKIS